MKGVGLAKGRIFNRSLLEKLTQELESVYFSQGKYNVKIDAKVEAALAAESRPAADVERDRNRKPVETLEFFGLRDDMRVVELLPGGGWYTKLLAPVVQENGEFYAALGTGRVSRSLEHYLAEDDRRFNDWMVDEIENLKQDLYDQWVVFHDLNPTNILVQRIGFDEYRLVVIDGIGHNHFIPLASFSSN